MTADGLVRRSEYVSRVVLLLCIIVFLLSCAKKAEPIVIGGGDVVLAFGDSLTAGVGADEGEAYPEQLAALLGVEVVNAGISGETTAEGRRRLASVLKDTQPQLVLLCLGGNDMLRKQSESDMRENLSSMITLIQQTGAEAVLLGVPEPALFSLDDHPAYASLAKAHDIKLISGLFAEVLSESALKSDRIHPNARGYRQVAERIAKRFRVE